MMMTRPTDEVTLEEKTIDASSTDEDIILEVKNLKKWFPIENKVFGKATSFVKAVDDVSFSVKRGEILGLVGESGCGKTTVSRTILGLTQLTSGEIMFDGKDFSHLTKKEIREERRKIQMVFQDPYSSLSPRMKVGETIAEPMEIYHVGNKASRKEKVEDLLEIVGLERKHAYRYPHEFSGGQRQRIGIARVLAADPKFMICDEPVSALDVSIRSQILNLLIDLRKQFGLTMLFISHDLSVMEYLCDRIVVMYLGRIMEIAKNEDIYAHPAHPYTEALISAIPSLDPEDKKRERIILKGDTPSPVDPPKGCRFCSRCAYAQDKCREEMPELVDIGEGHSAACHFPRI